MWLKKDSGGTSITWEGRQYHWPADGHVAEVPVSLGETLLGIHGGGYSEAQAPEPAPKEPPAAKPEVKPEVKAPAAK